MTSSSSTHDSGKIQKLTNSKDYPLWSVYVPEITLKDGLIHTLSDDPPNEELSTTAAVNKFRKEDEKARPHIVLNLREEPETLVTYLLMDKATTKVVWNKLSAV